MGIRERISRLLGRRRGREREDRPAAEVSRQEPVSHSRKNTEPPEAKRDEIVQRRARQAAEGILENESLTADLDDQAAKALNEWGVELARVVARETAELDDEAADTLLSQRMSATRQLMRSINKLAAHAAQAGEAETAELVTRLVEQASAVYGPGYVPPPTDQLLSDLAQLSAIQDTAQVVQRLHASIENPSSRADTLPEGAEDEQFVG